MSPGVTAARQAELNSGRDESRTLAEILAITHSALLTQVVPEAPEGLVEAAKRADSLGILARMQAMGEALYTHLGRSACQDLADHPADTVRGWAVFALVSQEKDADVDTLLALVRPAADDPHFGVREWAWMAVRPHLVPRLDEAIRARADVIVARGGEGGGHGRDEMGTDEILAAALEEFKKNQVQDAYSVRCAPQVAGGFRDTRLLSGTTRAPRRGSQRPVGAHPGPSAARSLSA